MKIERRTVLRGLLGGSAVGIGLPALECMLTTNGDALASGELLPVRFGLFFWGNGVITDLWNPALEGDASTYTLSEQLLPLQSLKSKIAVISGCRVPLVNQVPHMTGAAGILSGSPLTSDSTDDDYTFALPSIDQVIAQAVGDATRYRSLETGVEPGQGLSYNGPYSINPPESSPHALFERLFGVGFVAPGEDAILDPSIGLRRSVLDAVMEDSNRLMNRVGSVDRARLEQHLDGIRELERRLARMSDDPPDLAACERPKEPTDSFEDVDGRPPLAEKNRAMASLVAMALACDQTRVVSHYFSYPVDNLLFPDASAGHHSLTHDEPEPQPQCHAINIRIMESCADFLGALDAIPEGDGTLLDRCGVLCTTDVSDGRIHSLEDFPIVIAGSAGGRLRVGHHYRSPTGENASKVMLTLIRAMGVVKGSFGTEEGRSESGLSALEV